MTPRSSCGGWPATWTCSASTVRARRQLLGGRVALEAGLRCPERVDALVLLCPPPGVPPGAAVGAAGPAAPERLGLLPACRVPHAMVVEAIRAMMSVPERLAADWYDAGADEFRASAHAGRAARSSRRAADLSRARPTASRASGTGCPSLRPPSLFVWGDRDRLVPASFARHVARALPDAGAIVLEDCGHVPQIEPPTRPPRWPGGSSPTSRRATASRSGRPAPDSSSPTTGGSASSGWRPCSSCALFPQRLSHN